MGFFCFPDEDEDEGEEEGAEAERVEFWPGPSFPGRRSDRLGSEMWKRGERTRM